VLQLALPRPDSLIHEWPAWIDLAGGLSLAVSQQSQQA
jgi:hypothetical protein